MFGIDLIAEMVAAARREASRLGLENVTFDVASADQLPFAPDTFDAALNRFGVMFFPSPMGAVRDMLRVLKPGRKLALAVWHFADRNPFHCSLSRVVDRFIERPPVAPDVPDAFRFATPGRLLEMCAQAGVVSPVERVLLFTIDAPYQRKTSGRCGWRCPKSFAKRLPGCRRIRWPRCTGWPSSLLASTQQITG